MSVYVSSQAAPDVVEGEVPSGTIDGSNLIFTTANKFTMSFGGSQLRVHVNGVRQKFFDDYSVSESVPGLGFDTITFAVAPKVGDNLLVDYEIYEL